MLAVTSQIKADSYISSISLRSKGFRLPNAIGLIASVGFYFPYFEKCYVLVLMENFVLKSLSTDLNPILSRRMV